MTNYTPATSGCLTVFTDALAPLNNIGHPFDGTAFAQNLTRLQNPTYCVALPSVIKSEPHTLLGGAFIDEKQETINLLNKLPKIVSANTRITEILQNEAVIALCEKKIKEFIRNVLINQYKKEIIPEVTIIYF